MNGTQDPDEALYEERTELAWNRSGLALLAAFAILARRIWTDDTTVAGETLALALLAFASLGWAMGTLGWRLTHHRSDDPKPRSARELLGVTLGTLALAVASVVLSIADI